MSSLDQAFNSLRRSAELLATLEFPNGAVLPRSVLCSVDTFESQQIREVLPHEVGLFQSNKPTIDSWEDENGGIPLDDDKWIATKRRAPKRVEVGKEKPSPLKERQNKPGAPTNADPDRCLRAAQKLLEIYPLPRASEHVAALHSQWLGIVDSISDLEEQLRQPLARTGPAVQQHDESYYQLLSLEEEIKREELELLALEQFKQDRESELAALKPAPTRRPGPAARKVPSVVARSKISKPTAPSPPSDRPGVQTEPNEKLSPIPSPPPRPRSRPSTSSQSKPPEGQDGQPARRTRPSVPSAVPTPQTATTKRKSIVSTRRPSFAIDREATPPRASPPKQSPATTPTPREGPLMSSELPEGVTEEELEAVSKSLWRLMGDTLRPWAKKWARDESLDKELEEDGLDIGDTIRVLNSVLTSTFSRDAASPSSASISSYATSQATDDASDPSPPSPSTLVEFKLLHLLLTIISSSTPPSLPPSLPALSIVFRDPPADSSSSSPSRKLTKTPCLSMNALKAHLGSYAVGKGWTEGMGTTAVYALISKQVARIDRRGKEGAVVGFKV